MKVILEQCRVWEAIDTGYGELEENFSLKQRNKNIHGRNLIIQNVSDK